MLSFEATAARRSRLSLTEIRISVDRSARRRSLAPTKPRDDGGARRRVIGGKIIALPGITSLPASHLHRFDVIWQDVVGQQCFLNIADGAEQPAGVGERLGDLGDDSRWTQNRELRTERRQQVTAVTLSPVMGLTAYCG